VISAEEEGNISATSNEVEVIQTAYRPALDTFPPSHSLCYEKSFSRNP